MYILYIDPIIIYANRNPLSFHVLDPGMVYHILHSSYRIRIQIYQRQLQSPPYNHRRRRPHRRRDGLYVSHRRKTERRNTYVRYYEFNYERHPHLPIAKHHYRLPPGFPHRRGAIRLVLHIPRRQRQDVI